MNFFSIWKNKYTVIAFLCIATISILSLLSKNDSDLSMRERSISLRKIINNVAYTLSKRYNMSQIGDTVGMPGGIIELLGASFQKDSAPLEEARQIAIEGCLEFLQGINSNEVLRPYLVTYPFTAENISLAVFFDNNNYDKDDNNLNVVSCFKGNIYYRYMKKGENGDYSKEIKESFEEAMQKLEKKNAKTDK